ncbi:hypothetical protein [Clostridium beijerinckii]|uniref:hypothetical protein n=1 Tax=Clostridium beijerinckii TaxID=1520 RepID=UPI00047DF0BC|nr:hypothetical protein [Clostridium beijerinckii]
MKYNDTIDLLKIFANAILDPTSITKNNSKNLVFKYPRSFESNDSMDRSIYAESENEDEEYDESDSTEDRPNENADPYDNTRNNYYDKKEATSSNSQGIIDSITQEITPVRLQQAIILSEIVGKPKSKTRKRRF